MAEQEPISPEAGKQIDPDPLPPAAPQAPTSPHPSALPPSQTTPMPAQTVPPTDATDPPSPPESAATAEIPTEEPTPMIDIHDARDAAHTWTEFFIHIATIVLGLFIAVGLEQIVEHIHHHYQAKDARTELADELGNNRDVLRINVMQLHIHERNLRADLGVLDRLRTHSSAPGDRLLIFDLLRIFSDVHWKNAEESGATAYLSPDEQINYGFDYLQQDRFNAEADEAESALETAAAVLYNENTQLPQPRINGAILFDDKFTHSESATEKEIAASSPSLDFSRLTPPQIDRLELGIQQAIAADERLLSIAGIIQNRQEHRLQQMGAYARQLR